jgi:uncharacterized protein YjbJ (UPF0337 family)
VAETRGDAQDLAGELKAEAAKTADRASAEVRGTVEEVKGGVEKAVGGAKDEARRRARAIEKGVEKTGQDLKKEVIEGLLGPSKD